jgi:hypothetical protein
MDIGKFLNEARSFEEIVDKIADLAKDRSEPATSDLSGFLLVKDGNTYDNFSIPALTCRGFLDRGPDGVRLIASLIEKADGRILPATIVENLWFAAHGELGPISGMRGGVALPSILQTKPKPETIAAARGAFRDFVVQSQNDQDKFELLVHFMNINSMKGLTVPVAADALRTDVFQIIRESSIKITKALLDDYEQLLSQGLNEEKYQQFLSCNPVLLDPLASRVIPKQPLGLEFKTDYVIQRLDNQYFAVEIEKPQDLLFTRADDFSAGFTHAFGQVIDFLEWVDTHAEYARHHMPGISSPRGVLVMGMRTQFSPAQGAKLKRLCINTPNIEVLTFDDVLERGRTLYSNIHRNASV